MRLQRLFLEVVKYFDCTIECGHRGKEAQNAAFAAGKSKLKFPQSKHNVLPSLAVDVSPYPVNYKDVQRYYYFAGQVVQIAREMELAVRWGGDWDGDSFVNDQNFNDLVHFEIPE
jgi:hypothetical protein